MAPQYEGSQRSVVTDQSESQSQSQAPPQPRQFSRQKPASTREFSQRELSQHEFPTATAVSANPINTTHTYLEGAFVDPAYTYPPADGQGKHAIELQASSALLKAVDEPETHAEYNTSYDVPQSSPSPKNRVRTKTTTTYEQTESYRGLPWMRCCRQTDTQVIDQTRQVDEEELARIHSSRKLETLTREERKVAAKEERRQARNKTRLDRKTRELEANKYSRVAEGILVYRLDTYKATISLLSGPSSNTDTGSLMTEMVVHAAYPCAEFTHRRAIALVGEDGRQEILTACEQRTAIAWLEAIEMMLSRRNNISMARGLSSRSNGSQLGEGETPPAMAGWGNENLTPQQRNSIAEDYLNLTAYTNDLIRTGGIPSHSQSHRHLESHDPAGNGIYYGVNHETVNGEAIEEEALESIAKRRAVIKDSWDFYRMICSLLRDRRKYVEVFEKLKLDPVYPYLHSMTGLNDPGDSGYQSSDKEVLQPALPHYRDLSRTEVISDLIEKAEEALPSLVEICKALAGSLGMEEVGVGPIKEIGAAIKKAEKKYDGDVLKVTDYCRALLVVKDFPTLLALLELARDSFGPLIKRVKLATLKKSHKSMTGGYRDCKINLELKNHICEIQVHLWPMWVVCGVDGFRHYRHCQEYSTDDFHDPFDALDGLDRKAVAELIVMAEEAVADMPLDYLEWYHEKFILDYFAEIGLFMKHNLLVWAEVTIRHLIKLRCESPDIGVNHHETIQLQKYLEHCLRSQIKKNRLSKKDMKAKRNEADDLAERIEDVESEKHQEATEAEKSLLELIMDPAEAITLLMDPNKKERELEDRNRKEVKASKKQWRKIRAERFAFLDANENDGMYVDVA
mmetsp:Transcript_18755/g.21570  ORF Transcript_18755/g.21570 Transcript_18755/m.21570 type:complete len:852 (+) Transcript_18755:158-2713(+)